MMNEFKQECTIILAVREKGKKFSWVGKLLNQDGECLVLAKKFMGSVSPAAAENAALEFGMEQALRLRQEKVELQTSFPCEKILQENKGKSAKKLPKNLSTSDIRLRELWSSFRLRRCRLISGDEERELLHEIQQEFKSKE